MVSFDIFRLMGSGKLDISSTCGILPLKTLDVIPLLQYRSYNTWLTIYDAVT